MVRQRTSAGALPVDAKCVQRHLKKWTDQHSGTCLPDSIAWAEDMARNIVGHMELDIGRENYYPMFNVQSVLIEREKEGLLALWSAP